MMLRRYVHSLRIMDTYLPLLPPGIHYFARSRTVRSIAISVSVCLSVGLSVPSHISKSAFPNFTKIAVTYLWPWISHYLTTMQYVMYFRFC